MLRASLNESDPLCNAPPACPDPSTCPPTPPACLVNLSSSPSLSSGRGQQQWLLAAPCAVLVLCFLVGLPSNLCVIAALVRKSRSGGLTNPTLRLMLNLAVSDALVLAAVPLATYALIYGWTLGTAACRLFYYLLNGLVYVGIVTVTVMAVYHNHTIHYPVANRQLAQRFQKRSWDVFLAGVWGLGLLLATPVLYTHSVMDKKVLRCQRTPEWDTLKVVVLLMKTLFGYILPFSILVSSYIGLYCVVQKTRPSANQPAINQTGPNLTRLVVSILVAFLLLFLPIQLVNVVDVSTTLLGPSSAAYARLKSFRLPTGDAFKSLALLKPCVNPFLYFFSDRQRLLEEFRGWRQRRREASVSRLGADTRIVYIA